MLEDQDDLFDKFVDHIRNKFVRKIAYEDQEIDFKVHKKALHHGNFDPSATLSDYLDLLNYRADTEELELTSKLLLCLKLQQMSVDIQTHDKTGKCTLVIDRIEMLDMLGINQQTKIVLQIDEPMKIFASLNSTKQKKQKQKKEVNNSTSERHANPIS